MEKKNSLRLSKCDPGSTANTKSVFVRVWRCEKVCILSVNRFLLSYFDLPGRKILGEGTAAKLNMTVSEVKYSGLLCGSVFTVTVLVTSLTHVWYE